jgi:hypothetical protein
MSSHLQVRGTKPTPMIAIRSPTVARRPRRQGARKSAGFIVGTILSLRIGTSAHHECIDMATEQERSLMSSLSTPSPFVSQDLMEKDYCRFSLRRISAGTDTRACNGFFGGAIVTELPDIHQGRKHERRKRTNVAMAARRLHESAS